MEREGLCQFSRSSDDSFLPRIEEAAGWPPYRPPKPRPFSSKRKASFFGGRRSVTSSKPLTKKFAIQDPIEGPNLNFNVSF